MWDTTAADGESNEKSLGAKSSFLVPYGKK